jgi:hypothetical protein
LDTENSIIAPNISERSFSVMKQEEAKKNFRRHTIFLKLVKTKTKYQKS